MAKTLSKAAQKRSDAKRAKKRGKKYQAAAAKLDANKLYSLAEAAALVKETSPTKFDSTIEVHMKLDVDTAQADQNLRSTVVLPHGLGREVRIIAFVEDSMVKDALSYGAMKAGSEELIEAISKGWLDFDVAVAHPNVMKNLGKIARTLGQKGLMPNPKAGTVTPDIAKAIAELKKGKVEYRNDKHGNLHNALGKVSFSADQIRENAEMYIKTIVAARPAGVKGRFIQSATLTSTMGPGIKVDVTPWTSQ